MRYPLAVAVLAPVVALIAALAVLPAQAATADPPAERRSAPLTASVPLADDSAEQTLERAARALSGDARRERPTDAPSGERVEATLILRDLALALPDLRGEDRRAARALLARPTDGAADPLGNGYTTASVKKCAPKICLHWVKRTADAPPGTGWANRSLAMMQKVYRFEVGKLGYRPPVRDPGVGGNSKFDVYLKDIGAGVYGYCVPEYRVQGTTSVASGYCVLDNDFKPAQFNGAPARRSLMVTAAHEFFHAIQFGYDYREDPWLLESTSTWMEERFADSADDNRQYLPFGTVRLPASSLDLFSQGALNHYGNWAFWEYLSQRYGNGVVQQVWNRSADFKGAPNQYSVRALESVLKSRGGLTKVFAAYSAANTLPSRAYPEGKKWPRAALLARFRHGTQAKRASFAAAVDHLASQSIRLTPDESLKSRKWLVRININGPGRSAAPAAYLTIVKQNGGLVRRAVPLTRQGAGRTRIGFSASSVRTVTITLVNASTRYRCRTGQPFACGGAPQDQDRTFRVNTAVVKR
ncbi:MAG: MXAN_6640 family putative metalloprotease [Nocardioides sp.]